MTVLVGARDRARGEAAVDGLRKSSHGVHLVVRDVADEQSVAHAVSTRRPPTAGRRRGRRADVLPPRRWASAVEALRFMPVPTLANGP